ncbi:SGNH/GDSL hydrolase family protein [Streptomyces sp. 8N616]|uniref:SGNH/GDSL hydrolase family protein n=1 Tax=Streptomyces sp. 8N616 TaxID=3457414 RepID=UPI003FD05F09
MPGGQRAVPRARAAAQATRARVADERSPQAIRYAALGDSLTEGVGDPIPGGGWRGWAALLAGGLGERAEFVNAARSGALTADVATEQLTLALDHRPHVASVIAGGNDTLRASFDIDRVADHLDTVLRTFHANGTVVLTACLPDPGRLLRLPALLAHPLARRMQAVNTVVHALSHRYGALHLHAAAQPWFAERAALSVDRLHPNELGHRALARQFHALLTEAGLTDSPPPSAESDTPAPGRLAQALWMATKGTQWVVARCQDLLPDLMRLAAAEGRHRLAGTAAVLDLRSHRAALHALAALAPAQPLDTSASEGAYSLRA